MGERCWCCPRTASRGMSLHLSVDPELRRLAVSVEKDRLLTLWFGGEDAEPSRRPLARPPVKLTIELPFSPLTSPSAVMSVSSVSVADMTVSSLTEGDGAADENMHLCGAQNDLVALVFWGAKVPLTRAEAVHGPLFTIPSCGHVRLRAIAFLGSIEFSLELLSGPSSIIYSEPVTLYVQMDVVSEFTSLSLDGQLVLSKQHQRVVLAVVPVEKLTGPMRAAKRANLSTHFKAYMSEST